MALELVRIRIVERCVKCNSPAEYQVWTIDPEIPGLIKSQSFSCGAHIHNALLAVQKGSSGSVALQRGRIKHVSD